MGRHGSGKFRLLIRRMYVGQNPGSKVPRYSSVSLRPGDPGIGETGREDVFLTFLSMHRPDHHGAALQHL
jgi:hypothetical protein